MIGTNKDHKKYIDELEQRKNPNLITKRTRSYFKNSSA